MVFSCGTEGLVVLAGATLLAVEVAVLFGLLARAGVVLLAVLAALGAAVVLLPAVEVVFDVFDTVSCTALVAAGFFGVVLLIRLFQA